MQQYNNFLQFAGLEPKPYQSEGVRWCLNNETVGVMANGVCVRGGLLADEMGLGKTIQMIGAMVTNPKHHTLIVLPRALLEQWKDVIIRTLHHKPLVYHGSVQASITQDDLDAAPIVLTTYGMVATAKNQDGTEKERTLHQVAWDRVIFDEAHHLRNHKTRTHIGSLKIKAPIRWLVTGTPIQNTKKDFYSLCAAMGIPSSYYTKTENLLPLARQFMMKRTKAEVGLNLPECREAIVPTPWQNPAELELAEDIHSLLHFSGSQKSLADNKMRNMSPTENAHLAMLVRARQSCVYPPLLEGAIQRMIDEGLVEDTQGLRQALQCTSKIDSVVAKILDRKDNGRGKLVFCHYRGEIDVLKQGLSRQGMHVETFDGRIPPAARNEILTKKCDVLILQIKTGCEGLNLQHFSEVYFVSPHWNPAVEDQAVARCHRIGQESEIDVFRFHAVGGDGENGKLFSTLDEYSADVQTAKRTIMQEIDNK